MNQRSEVTHDRFTQRSGEFLRVYGWQRNEDGNYEPVMVIYRTAYPTHVPFGVPLRTAYRFVDSEHLMTCAFRALDHFGMLTTRDSAIKLATVIQDGIEDLLDMPPKPSTADTRRDEPDAIITVNGKEIAAWE